MKIGNREFDVYNDTYVMGILNVTPDSFSDGGRFVVSNWEGADISQVLRACDKMLSDGADIIDVGGESTKPGVATVSAAEEMERILPVIEAIKKRFDTVLSVDTYKAEVAGEAIRAGADMVNDIWGLKGDKYMPKAVAEMMGSYEGVALCLMHNRRPADVTSSDVPMTMHGEEIEYGYRKSSDGNPKADEALFMEDVISDLTEGVLLAKDAGVDLSRVILDPGVGFAKTYEQNLAVMRRIEELKRVCDGRFPELKEGFPLLLGSSRKSVIGKALDAAVDERLSGTLATTALAVFNHVGFVRVHDVKPNADVIRMLKAIRE